MGNWGNGWSRTSKSATNAYHLAFNPTEVYPSNNNNRWNGLPLRLVVRFGADLREKPPLIVARAMSYRCYRNEK